MEEYLRELYPSIVKLSDNEFRVPLSIGYLRITAKATADLLSVNCEYVDKEISIEVYLIEEKVTDSIVDSVKQAIAWIKTHNETIVGQVNKLVFIASLPTPDNIRYKMLLAVLTSTGITTISTDILSWLLLLREIGGLNEGTNKEFTDILYAYLIVLYGTMIEQQHTLMAIMDTLKRMSGTSKEEVATILAKTLSDGSKLAKIASAI